MPLINCEINPILTWSENCLTFSATGAATFSITETLLTQDKTKLL